MVLALCNDAGSSVWHHFASICSTEAVVEMASVPARENFQNCEIDLSK